MHFSAGWMFEDAHRGYVPFKSEIVVVLVRGEGHLGAVLPVMPGDQGFGGA
jgi:hypothetical protein